MTDQFLEILRCPQDGSRLRRAPADALAKINRAIEAGTLTNRAGAPVEKPLDGGLVRAAGDLLYPIIDGIPVILPDEAIDLTRV